MGRLFASKNPEISQREIRNMERSRKIASQGMVLLENNGVLPFRNVKTLAAFGSGVRRTVKGGTGSGDVNSRTVVNVEQGLTEAGFTLTGTAWLDRYDQICADAFEAYNADFQKRIAENRAAAVRSLLTHPYRDPTVPEILESDLAEKADAALYVIARNSGEGSDRHPVPGDYELSDTEKQNIEALSKVYDNIVVVLNVGGVIDTKFLRSCPKIGAILNMSQAGNISGYALADVLTGKVTPSGHLTMTWAENYLDYACADTFSHMNGDVNDEYYNDGIYVGYRYFDTFNITPAYPFGYGQSYTVFSVQTDSVKLDGSTVEVIATVTNTGGTYSGKETVQVYYSAPAGELEKPYQALAGFAKTKELAPGASETLVIRFPVSGMASYCEKCASYVLEPGRYYIRVGSHSRNTHIAAALELGERKVTSILKNKAQPDAELALISPAGKAPYSYAGEENEKAAAPVLTIDASAIETETVTYSGAPETMVTDKTETITMEDVLRSKASLSELVAQLTVEEMAELVIGTARGGFGSNSNIGAASTTVPGAAGDTTSILTESRGIPNIVLADGPAGLRLTQSFVADGSGVPIPGLAKRKFGLFNLGGAEPERPADAEDYYQFCTAIPIATLLAQSWDMALIADAGDIVGEEMEEFGVTLWLAPGMNIMRNSLCGRNFEYYSEDPLLAGLCAAADTLGVQKHPGCGTCIKHFALNNLEENRYGSNSHCSERALREIYAKGFEIAVKHSQPLSLMTSYNLINGEHAANKYDVITSMLRDEWGFEGIVMTDWGTTGVSMGHPDPATMKYQPSDPAGCVKAGNDLTMPGSVRDLETIIKSVGAKPGEVRCPITLAELQACAYRILKVIFQCEAARRNAK